MHAMWIHGYKMCIQRIERRKLRGSSPRSFQEKGNLEPSLERKEGYGLADSSHSSHLADQQILLVQGPSPKGTVMAGVWAAPACSPPHNESRRQVSPLSENGPWQMAKRIHQCDRRWPIPKGGKKKQLYIKMESCKKIPTLPLFLSYGIVKYFLASLGMHTGFSYFNIWMYMCSTVYSPFYPSPFLCSYSHPLPLPTPPQKTNKNKTNKQICGTSYLEWFKSLYTIKRLSNDWLPSRWLCSLLNSSISEQRSLTRCLARTLSLSLIEFCQVHAALLEGAVPN